jgi:hypothetical protein
MFPRMTTNIALAGAAHGSARWPVIALEIALVAAVCTAGVLADRRVRQRRRAASGARGRAVPRVPTVMRPITSPAPRTSAALHNTCIWPAPTTLIRSYADADAIYLEQP